MLLVRFGELSGAFEIEEIYVCHKADANGFRCFHIEYFELIDIDILKIGASGHLFMRQNLDELYDLGECEVAGKILKYQKTVIEFITNRQFYSEHIRNPTIPLRLRSALQS